MKTCLILGAPDPEMVMIEKLVKQVNEFFGGHTYEFIYATKYGKRVHPWSAYRPDAIPTAQLIQKDIVLVECSPVMPAEQTDGIVIIDHHRPGDPGYGIAPEDYWRGSSIGQTVEYFVKGAGQGGRELLELLNHSMGEYRLAAAADHCLAAAYAGKCPGVEPTALMNWRTITRAGFQRRKVKDVLSDVESATRALREAPRTIIGTWEVAEIGAPLPELPEAAARVGQPFIVTTRHRNGRRKTVLQAAEAELVFTWMKSCGLDHLYGDPARGFAGGYLKE